MTRLIIAGGGLAGSLAALALARRRPGVELLLLEQGATFGGNHTWSFFDTDVPEELRWVLDEVDAVRWPEHEVHFPDRSRTIPIGYNSIRSADLDRSVRRILSPDQYRLNSTIRAVGPSSVTFDGETISADGVIDARGPSAMRGLDLGWQKFVGRFYRFPRPHGVPRPVIMDATVDQIDGYRFIYQLPISPAELLVEDTYYSATPLLEHEILGERIDRLAMRTGGGPADVIDEESGVLPVVLDGDVDAFWHGEEVPRLGLRGGFFHPTTSYSLPDAVANASLIAQQSDLTSTALFRVLRLRAERLWQDRAFYRVLNRMLFRAAEPDQAYRVLEHFYRLSPQVIGRFYGARLTSIDKIRILSGKPPVPVARALSALRRSAA
jgi:lycopene beta-cyclase